MCCGSFFTLWGQKAQEKGRHILFFFINSLTAPHCERYHNLYTYITGTMGFIISAFKMNSAHSMSCISKHDQLVNIYLSNEIFQ
jgi:hypothetical protein